MPIGGTIQTPVLNAVVDQSVLNQTINIGPDDEQLFTTLIIPANVLEINDSIDILFSCRGAVSGNGNFAIRIGNNADSNFTLNTLSFEIKGSLLMEEIFIFIKNSTLGVKIGGLNITSLDGGGANNSKIDVPVNLQMPLYINFSAKNDGTSADDVTFVGAALTINK